MLELLNVDAYNTERLGFVATRRVPRSVQKKKKSLRWLVHYRKLIVNAS